MTEIQSWLSLVAYNVAHYRAQAGLTLDDVAAASGVTLGYIHNIENRRSNPTLATLLGIASALDIEPSLLFLPQVDPAGYLKSKTEG